MDCSTCDGVAGIAHPAWTAWHQTWTVEPPLGHWLHANPKTLPCYGCQGHLVPTTALGAAILDRGLEAVINEFRPLFRNSWSALRGAGSVTAGEIA